MKESDASLESLALTLFDIGAVQLGTFKLHSGRLSPIYLDLRLLPSHPRALRQAAAAYRPCLQKLRFDLLAAAPLAGLPIGTAICLDMERPLIFPRKASKGHGTGKQVEGAWTAGQTAVVIDDVVTSGDSILQTIAALETAGLAVTDAVVLIDRGQGGVATVQAQGYTLHTLFSLPAILDVLVQQERITAAQRHQVLQALA